MSLVRCAGSDPKNPHLVEGWSATWFVPPGDLMHAHVAAGERHPLGAKTVPHGEGALPYCQSCVRRALETEQDTSPQHDDDEPTDETGHQE